MGRVATIAGHRVEQYTSPNVGGTMTDHRGAVLHSAEGSYRGTIAWQLNPDQRYSDGTRVTTSSTWILGRNTGEVAQMVDSEQVAWCQRSGSLNWLSIELAGFAPQPPSAWQIEACAHLLAWAHERYPDRIPLQMTSSTSGRGLGHHSMDNDTTVQWGHDACPGTGIIAAKSAIIRRAQSLGDDMTPEQANQLAWIDARVEAMGKGLLDLAEGRPGEGQDVWLVRTLNDIKGAVTNLATRPPVTVDVTALASALAEELSGSAYPIPDMEAACERAVRRVMTDAGTP